MRWIFVLLLVLFLLPAGGCNRANQPDSTADTPGPALTVERTALHIRSSEDTTEYSNIHHVSRPVLLTGPGEYRSRLLTIPPHVELETAFGISGGRYSRIKAQGGGGPSGEPRPVIFEVCFEKLDDGSVVTMHQEPLDAAPSRNQQWWVERRIALTPAAGATGRLIFRIGEVPRGKAQVRDKEHPVPVWAESVLHPTATEAHGKLILLVSADTCRADVLGSYGYHRTTTPHLDAFSRDCLLFQNAYATSPWTLPSHASLLTATYPNVHQLETYHPTRLSPDISTITECLSARGFHTAAFVDMGFITPFKGLHRGFDIFDYRGLGIRTIGDRVLGWITDRPGDDLFVFFHFYDIHYPYDEQLPGRNFASTQAPPGFDARFLKKNPPQSPEVAQHLRDLYDNGVAYTDMEFGRFLARLRASGRYDDALIVFLSDHGEEFGEHGRLGHQMALFQESLAIPLMIKWPRGNRSDSLTPLPASLVDVMPTILGFCGLDAPPQSEGIDLLSSDPVLTDTRYVFGETVLEENSEALVGRQFKLIHQAGSGFSYIDLHRNPDESPPMSDEMSTEHQAAIKQSLTVNRLWRRPGLQLWFGGLEPGALVELDIGGRDLTPGQAFTYWADLDQPPEQRSGRWHVVLKPLESLCGLVLGMDKNPAGPLEVTARIWGNGDTRSIPLAVPPESGIRTGAVSCPQDGVPPGSGEYALLVEADSPRGLIHYRSRSPVAPPRGEEDEEILSRLRELGYIE